MPQRINVIYICSLCDSETDQPGKMTGFQITGLGRALEYDICTSCAEVGPFRDLLDRGLHGKNLRANQIPATASGQASCPECGDLFTPTGLSLHRSRAHGVLSAHAAKAEARGKEGSHVCPNQGCGFATKRSQGLGVHKKHCTFPKPRTRKAAAG